jgi:hypothetical protein
MSAHPVKAVGILQHQRLGVPDSFHKKVANDREDLPIAGLGDHAAAGSGLATNLSGEPLLP